MKTLMTITALLISTLLLGACSTAAKPNVKAKQPRQSVADIMRGQFGQTARAETFRRGPGAITTGHIRAPQAADYSRTQASELNGIFPRLPNPDVCMYIEPHLSLEGATIPGYTSCFSMYDKNHYALPGEMSAIWLK